MKKKYHVVFFLNKQSNVSLGKNYNAKDEIDALGQFKLEFKDAIFLYLASEEIFYMKYI